MAAFLEFVLALVDLVKAELAVSRKKAARIVGGLVCLWVGGALLMGAYGLALAALYLGLLEVFHPAWAALLTAAAALLSSVLMLLIGAWRVRA